MAAISMTAELEASSDEVWAKLSDTGITGQWLATHVGYPEGAPEYAEGNSFTEKVTIMGMPGEVAWKVVKLIPGSAVELEGTGPMGTTLKAAYSVEPNGDSTKVTFETEFGGEALAAMAQPLENASKQALEKSIEQFKALVG